MKFEIKCRFTAKVLFECEAVSLKAAVERAVEARVSLVGANLARAYLAGANLARANLADADLAGANLAGAYLAGANLADADLAGAYLAGANLAGANLAGANLAGANLARAYLAGANLAGANLAGANLARANLAGADLADTEKDFKAKLKLAHAEVPGLYKSLMDGRVDGSAYEGECACFVGTIANVRGVKYEKLAKEIGLEAQSTSPTERLFLAIRKGDTPDNNQVSRIVTGWLTDWAKENDVKLPTRRVIWE